MAPNTLMGCRIVCVGNSELVMAILGLGRLVPIVWVGICVVKLGCVCRAGRKRRGGLVGERQVLFVGGGGGNCCTKGSCRRGGTVSSVFWAKCCATFWGY